MGLLNKIKEKFQPDDLPARLKKGKITYDEALDELSLTFARSCNGFYEMRLWAARRIDKYNGDIDSSLRKETIKCIDEFENGTVSKTDSLNNLTISMHKELLQDAIDDLSYRNNVYLRGAATLIKGAKEELAPIAGVKFDEKDFIQRCARPEAVKYAKENRIDDENDTMYVNTGLLSVFMRLVNVYIESLVNDEPTCFNEREQIIDKSGRIIEPGGDIFASIRYLDYKGY